MYENLIKYNLINIKKLIQENTTVTLKLKSPNPSELYHIKKRTVLIFFRDIDTMIRCSLWLKTKTVWFELRYGSLYYSANLINSSYGGVVEPY